MSNQHKITIPNWQLSSGKSLKDVPLTYQIFGPAISAAPVVLVNHALTGNSNVSGPDGWWNTLIGPGKTIDTTHFTVVAFNIPGNSYGSDFFIENYAAVTVADVAALFWQGLKSLGVNSLFAIIGGSLGGGVTWHMAAQQPDKLQHLIPVATDHKATDWVIANVLVQDRILNNSTSPVADARLHAMLLYRTPQSLQERFERNYTNGAFAIEHWLNRHGKKLEERFALPAYKLMNHLLKTIDVDLAVVAAHMGAAIHLVAVDTDLLFTPNETRKTFELLKAAGAEVCYNEIQSAHGHDAFLIEHTQLAAILKPVFVIQNSVKVHKEDAKLHKV
ncbi:MAG: alpha/beta fold hydrolase [Bacteroidota bacterium]